MNCPNCGAPMELFDRRRYFYCHHCGTFHFVETEAVDGVRVLERREEALACPLCSHKLARSLLDDVHVVEHCERCRGVLIGRSSFADAVVLRRAREKGAPVPPQPLDRRELERSIRCPACGGRMDVHPYYGPGNVVIDTCATCDLVWLDHGELRQITDAPGRDRGAPRPTSSPSAGALDQVAARMEPGRRVSLLDVFGTLLE